MQPLFPRVSGIASWLKRIFACRIGPAYLQDRRVRYAVATVEHGGEQHFALPQVTLTDIPHHNVEIGYFAETGHARKWPERLDDLHCIVKIRAGLFVGDAENDQIRQTFRRCSGGECRRSEIAITLK